MIFARTEGYRVRKIRDDYVSAISLIKVSFSSWEFVKTNRQSDPLCLRRFSLS